MTQKQIDDYNLKLQKNNTKATQTSDDHEILVSISDTKKIHLYKSNSYKSYVVSFDFGSSTNLNHKKFILNKEGWLIFRKHIEEIDEIMINN
jgi:hypothetical protein